MARITKYEIAKAIEELPGNTPWGLYFMMTVYYENYSRAELVEMYNDIITKRGLQIPQIS